ncbi:unnamed protein product [Thlaspi arvense]|uniref:Auxin response factor n=1 Tax=Thlaspi arvense TaxID=13288 RepID=A0AAU9SUB1_THLAR|nr:unnamed protein product [Thlaspi arvense]
MFINDNVFISLVDETNNYLYDELCKLCGGPLFDLPKIREKVYYFPQGHIEFLEAYSKDDLGEIPPIFDIPSKIRCNVIDIQFKVENDTDDIYAKISLLPDTADMSQPTPTQEIVAKDLHDYEWRFKHTFRGTPKRHIFTTGWSAFARAKKLVRGDSFVFLRGENGESRVGIRRAAHQQDNIPSSIISKQSMHHGIIVSAMNAISTKCMFNVFCKPRSSQFIVNFEKYIDAMNKKFKVDTNFTMQFEDASFTEIRYSGKIINNTNCSSHWRDSDWRSLEVKWDVAASIPRPDKVSPWEIEPLAPSSNIIQSHLKNKRSRHVDGIGKRTLFNKLSPLCEIVLIIFLFICLDMLIPTLTQGQEIGQSSMNSPMSISQLSNHHATDYSKISSSWPMNYSVPTISKPDSNNQMVMSANENITIDATSGYKLFGVDLTTPTETKDLIEQIDLYQKVKTSKISEEEKIEQIQTLTSSKDIQSQQINSTRSRIKMETIFISPCILIIVIEHVQMQGVAIGRAVDLTVLDGYDQLIDELEKNFDLKDELRMGNQWEIVFADDEGDMMLVGDDPWM